MKLPYKGAGILFLKRENDSNIISLGKRTHTPQSGYWSIPGGEMSDKDDDDFLSCALRETLEEYFSSRRTDTLSNIMRLKANKRSRIKIPFLFEFHTYLIDAGGIETDFTPNHEFSEVRWFETHKLPEKTHIGVRYSLLSFGLR